jgi:hypothetical protein
MELDLAMSVCSDVADYHWLTGEEAAIVLRDLANCDTPLHTSASRLRRHLSPHRAHLILEQTELRRRAAAKFAAAERMYFTRAALEQSSDEHVARYKATRFASRHAAASSSTLIADFCCGIGGDLCALVGLGNLVAVDCNPIATHLAAANLRALHPNARAEFHTADVTGFEMAGIEAWHIDPDRRAGGRRTTSLAACQPGFNTIERLLQQLPHAAVKLAPATRVPDHWARRCEREWISRGGVCRQQVAWHGNLADAPGHHRATIVSSASGSAATRTIMGKPNELMPSTAHLKQYIFDFDPAVHAAHLQGALSDQYELSALALGPTYFTGSAPLSDAALSCFHVDDVLPLRVKSIAGFLRKRRVGQLEIKKRGVDIVPEQLRRELKLRGNNAATLLITPIAGRATAIFAHRIS